MIFIRKLLLNAGNIASPLESAVSKTHRQKSLINIVGAEFFFIMYLTVKRQKHPSEVCQHLDWSPFNF